MAGLCLYKVRRVTPHSRASSSRFHWEPWLVVEFAGDDMADPLGDWRQSPMLVYHLPDGVFVPVVEAKSLVLPAIGLAMFFSSIHKSPLFGFNRLPRPGKGTTRLDGGWLPVCRALDEQSRRTVMMVKRRLLMCRA